MQKIRHIIGDTYRQHRYLLDALCFTEAEKHQFTKVMNCEMDDVTAQDALKNLSCYLNRYNFAAKTHTLACGMKAVFL